MKKINFLFQNFSFKIILLLLYYLNFIFIDNFKALKIKKNSNNDNLSNNNNDNNDINKEKNKKEIFINKENDLKGIIFFTYKYNKIKILENYIFYLI